MSYCRWSSDNGRCDVYVYEDASGGWTTHVAARRRLFAAIPALPISWAGKGDDWKGRLMRRLWAWSYQFNMWMVGLIPLRDTKLPYNGATFNDPTPLACAVRLIELRRIGYNVPQRAIDALVEEHAQSQSP